MMHTEELSLLIQEVITIISDMLFWVFSIPGIVVIIPVSIGIYSFFKSIQRLVYVVETTNISSKKLNPRYKSEIKNLIIYKPNLLVSNILIYNNGRKTINRNDLIKLYINLGNEPVLKVSETRKHSSSFINLVQNRIEIYLDNFDKRDFLAVRIFHTDNIKVDGRIMESGEIMNTESKLWLIINIIIFSIIMIGFVIAICKIEDENFVSWKWVIIMILISSIYLLVYRLINYFFFIPSSITNKYVTLEK